MARNLLGLWFCGLSLLGYLRFFMKVFRTPPSALDAVAWLWLGGSVALSIIGVALIMREVRRRV